MNDLNIFWIFYGAVVIFLVSMIVWSHHKDDIKKWFCVVLAVITLSSCGTMRTVSEPPRYYALTDAQLEALRKENDKKGLEKVAAFTVVGLVVVGLIVYAENDKYKNQ